MSYKYNEIMKMISNGNKPFLMYQISKDEVVTGDMAGLDEFFKTITRLGVYARQGVSIMCSGYDDVSDELYEIQDVRKFVQKMFNRFPYILYYINLETESEHWLLSSVADNINSVADYDVKKMNAHEIFEKYGFEPPRVQAMLTFHGDNLAKILKPIIAYGKKNDDQKIAKRIAIEYAMRFDKWEKTLEEMGIRL